MTMLMHALIINRTIWEQMRQHVNSIYPQEACGLLAGIGNEASQFFPINNILKSNHRYRMDAQEQLTSFLKIEKENCELLGIYHSHPQGAPYPSETDIAEAYYPDTPYLIWALDKNEWVCQAFFMKNQKITPIKIMIKEEI